MVETDIHSRSRLAGYQPELLFNSTALIVGVGALGQNLALNLALAGIGELDIVDFDVFEAHNATRSPLYPSPEEQARWGREKAKVVAHKLFSMMTAPAPKVRYAVAPIQSLGDLPIAHAQLTFSAVDNQTARAYLAEHCRLVRRPLLEAGFHAEMLNLSVFGSDADEPCYRCLYPEMEGAFSCTQYALELEEAHVIPAIQNTAAVLAGLQAEAGLQWLHGDESLRNKRVYGNIRTMFLQVVQLANSLQCPGIHQQSVNAAPMLVSVKADEPLELLLSVIEKELGPAQIRFLEDLVMRNFCTKCGLLTEAHVPAWKWLLSSRCTNCGGPFALAAENRQVASKAGIHTSEEDEVRGLSCHDVGLPPGTTIEVWPDKYPNECYLLQIAGSIDEIMIDVTSP